MLEIMITPAILPLSFTFSISLLRPSTINKKRKEDWGQPYLIPLELRKKTIGTPLTNTKKLVEDTQNMI